MWEWLSTEQEMKEKETWQTIGKGLIQGCIANAINTLFSVIGERGVQLKLSSDEAGEIHSGQIALACLTDRMADISGMNEKVQNIKEEVHAVSKEEVENFLDFLKEILG